ncbi:GerAB/ArcD/ProY family transporter [Neobacillus massiliamazoniensis]|uniref:Spore germination protein GerXB n=1 Tax=Neobacillus massiliamazoniensis TaxID=1499688 RepID=A0A0U1NXS3_9BACI|nr:endospore germination permease [Neobacillus massiliamazoniensis]CRK82678.1 spore germination protein GerXB [Neobacillus massiliamazoniensis]
MLKISIIKEVITIKSSDSISNLQLVLLIITVTGLNNHVFIISPLIQTAGRDAWLAVFVTLILILLWCLLLFYIHRKVNGEHIFKWLRGYAGSWVSNFFVFIIILYFTIMAAVTLKEMITFINITFLPETPLFFLTLLFGFLCWFLADTSLRTISIINAFLLFFIVIFGFFVAIGNFQFKNYSLLLPFLEHGYKPVMKSLIFQASGMVELILFIFLQHKTEDPFRFRHFAVTAILLTVLTLGPLIGAIVEFGPTEASKQRFPPYEEWGLLSLGNYVEHVDFLSVYQWLSGTFIRISLFVYVSKEIIPVEKSQRWLLISILVAIVIMALVPISDFKYSEILKFVILPATVWFVLALSIFLGFLVAILKKRWRSTDVV